MWQRLWRTSPELVTVAMLMLVVLAGTIVGLTIDPRVITGAPAWLKPAKFAVSIAIYTMTLAWIFTLIPEWTRTRRVVGRLTAFVMVLEMAIISAQAGRGITSHFNVSTPFNAVLFGTMGVAIIMQTLSTIAVAVALWRHPFADRALGWALRFGMSLTIVGALTGPMMTRPTAAQLEAARAGEPMTTAGAHTIGGPDGGPGLIGTGWSTEHGDVRVAHFVGLHALQIFAALAWLLTWLQVAPASRTRLILVAGPSYAAFYVILLVQALRGVPAVAPDATTLVELATWAVVTAVAATFLVRGNAAPARTTAAL